MVKVTFKNGTVYEGVDRITFDGIQYVMWFKKKERSPMVVSFDWVSGINSESD